LTREQELGIGKDRRRVDINEEYYRLAAKVCASAVVEYIRLMAKVGSG